MRVPPRVPNGRPGRRRSCERSSGTRNESMLTNGDGVPTASRLTLSAAREIALEQRRRQLQHAGDVVEAVARIVGRQQLGDVDVERRAGREPRCDTRRGSSGGTARCGRDSGCAAAARRARLRASRRAQARCVGRRPRLADGGGIMPARSLRTTCSHSAGWAATSLERQRLRDSSRPSARCRRGSSCSSGPRWPGADR